MLEHPTALLLLVVLGGIALRKYFSSSKLNPQRLPLPPGPKPLPIVGNLFDVPKSLPWVTYANWGKLHGGCVQISQL